MRLLKRRTLSRRGVEGSKGRGVEVSLGHAEAESKHGLRSETGDWETKPSKNLFLYQFLGMEYSPTDIVQHINPWT